MRNLFFWKYSIPNKPDIDALINDATTTPSSNIDSSNFKTLFNAELIAYLVFCIYSNLSIILISDDTQKLNEIIDISLSCMPKFSTVFMLNCFDRFYGVPYLTTGLSYHKKIQNRLHNSASTKYTCKNYDYTLLNFESYQEYLSNKNNYLSNNTSIISIKTDLNINNFISNILNRKFIENSLNRIDAIIWINKDYTFKISELFWLSKGELLLGISIADNDMYEKIDLFTDASYPSLVNSKFIKKYSILNGIKNKDSIKIYLNICDSIKKINNNYSTKIEFLSNISTIAQDIK